MTRFRGGVRAEASRQIFDLERRLREAHYALEAIRDHAKAYSTGEDDALREVRLMADDALGTREREHG